MPPYNVLIVDDQRDVRRVLRAGLETFRKDIKVVDVPSGEEAILVISRQPIDLLVTDIRLPGISGLELKERAQVRNPNLRFILITGMADVKVRGEVARAGADAYFFKPVEMSEFIEAVQDCLQISKPILPVKGTPPAEGQKPSPDQGLAERLASLRREIQAVSAVILDNQSHVVAKAGTPPEFASKPKLLACLKTVSEAAVDISSQMDADIPRGVMYFPGRLYDLLLTPVGPSATLMLTLNPSTWNDENVARLFRLTRSAGQDLQIILFLMGPAPQSKREVEPVPEIVQTVPKASPDALPDLEAIFDRAQKVKLASEEIDAFWEAAAGAEIGTADKGDGISYDQALIMGIAPQDK